MNGTDSGKRGPEPEASADRDLSARLQRLGTQLDRKRDTAPARDDRHGHSVSTSTAIGRAFRMSTEFVAGIIAGGGLGWVFDRAFGTSPWGLIVFFMLGFAAGVFNMIRAAGLSTPPAGGAPGAKPDR